MQHRQLRESLPLAAASRDGLLRTAVALSRDTRESSWLAGRSVADCSQTSAGLGWPGRMCEQLVKKRGCTGLGHRRPVNDSLIFGRRPQVSDKLRVGAFG